jgi:autotransporter-associated beta strand protein
MNLFSTSYLAAFALAIASIGHAQTTNRWVGGGEDANWSTGLNWSNQSAPISGEVLSFQGSARLSNSNDLNGLVAAGMIFANSGNWTISGNALILSNASGNVIEGAAGRTVTISNDLTISATGNRQITTTATNNSQVRLSGTFSSVGMELRKAGGGSAEQPSVLVFDGAGRTVSMGQLTMRQGGVVFENGVIANIPTNYVGTDAAGGISEPFMTVRGEGTTLTSSVLHLGRTNNAGRFQVEGGVVSVTNLITGQTVSSLPANGYYQSGGQTTVGNLRNANNGPGTVVISGGILTTTINLGARLSEAGMGIFTVSGGAQVFIGTNGSQNFSLGFSGGTAAIGNGTLNLNGGVFATAAFNKSGTSSSPGETVINLNGGTIRGGSSTENYLNSLAGLTVNVLDGGVVFDTAGFNITVKAPLVGVGSGGLVKTGTGRLDLNGTNSYTGLTSTDQGTLLVSGTLLGEVEVRNGAVLGGAGTIGGPVNVSGVIRPGAENAGGRLTISNAVQLQPAATATFRLFANGSNGQILATGGAELAGTVNVELASTYTNIALGDSFNLFSGTALSGSPVLVLPNLPSPDLAWATNRFLSEGVISVTNASAPAGYDAWLTNYPTLSNTNRTADPDGDGFDNNTEFAFDGNPTVGTPALIQAASDGAVVTVSFVANRQLYSQSAYSVLSSSNLTSGFVTNASFAVVDSPNQSGVLLTNDYIRKEFQAPLGANQFFRIRCSTP